MGKHKLSNKQRLKLVYDSLPKIACKKLCQNSCGVIPVNRVELKKLQASTDIDLHAYATTIDSGKTMLFNPHTEACPLLQDGLCSVHENRPLLCRLFGVVPQMRCPHGCIPERWLTQEEAMNLFREFEEMK